MAAFNFKKRWREPVRAGTKRQTVRAPRADGRDPEPGQQLQLYYGMRTKQCELLRRARCTGRKTVTIDFGHLEIDGRVQNEGQRDIFAIADGFEHFDDLQEFFAETHGLPFSGFVYYWDPDQH